MENENLLEILDKSKSISDALRNLGMCDNGLNRSKLLKISSEVNFDLNIYKIRKERFCIKCGTKLIKGQHKFCSSSCSAKYNNTGRQHTTKTKNKISEKMKIVNSEGPIVKYNIDRNKIKRRRKNTHVNTYINTCSVCGKNFTVTGNKQKIKKTCSDECRIKATTFRKYLNGSRKTIYYVSKKCGEVILESTWELILARFLDSIDANWIRPKPIPWVDSNNKKHLYYSDFYLIDYNIYVDPKNKYCIKKDEEKLNYFNTRINLIYGEIHEVISKVNEIINGKESLVDLIIYNVDDYLLGIMSDDINPTIKTFFCKKCGKKLKFNGKNKLCRDCYNLENNIKPSKEELLEILKTKNITSASKIFNVHRSTLKKWVLYYNL